MSSELKSSLAAGFLVLWTTCCVPVALAAPSPKLAPLPVEEALKTKQIAMFTSIASSPDGRYVAYTVQDNNRADRSVWSTNGNWLTETGAYLTCYGCDVHVTDQKTGETVNASGSVGSSYYVSWSPDSHHLAFYSDRDGQMRVWTWEVATRKLRRVSDVPALPNPPLPPLWGDSGRKLLVSLLPEHTTFAEANRRISAQADPVEMPEGSTIAVYSHEHEADDPSPATRKMQGYDGFGNPIVRDLAQIDVATGEHRRLFRAFSGNLVDVSADGRYAIATVKGGVDETNYNDSLFDILVLDMASGAVVMRIEDVPMLWGISASWAPSGHRFAYITGSISEMQTGSPYHDAGMKRRAGDVFVAEVGGEPVNLSPGEHPSFSTGDRPIWSADGRAIYLMGADLLWRADVDGRTTQAVTKPDAQRRILKVAAVRNLSELWQPQGANRLFAQVSNSQTLHEEFCAIDIDTGAVTPVLQEAQSYKTGVSSALMFDAANGTAPAVFGAQSATRAPELFATRDFGEVRQLTRLNPAFERYVMGESRLVTWQGRDGKEYKGTLLLPAGYRPGQRYPMVVWQRPSNVGSFALDVFGLLMFENFQVLATRGYAVFYPDFPARNSREVPQVARDVVFPGIDRVVELGIADADRIGVTGTSWGGYSTLALLALTDRFKVAVAESGPSNHLDSFSVMLRNGNSVRVQEVSRDLGGTPWTARQAYIDHSPIFHLDKITTPLMLVHARGDGDYSIPQDQASQVFVGLRHLNRTSQMLIYDGGHGFATASYADQAEIWSRIIAWYDRFLKPEYVSPAQTYSPKPRASEDPVQP